MTSAQHREEALGGLAAYRRLGLFLVGLLAITMVLWGAFAQIAGAVVATGRIAVETAVKKVQHKEGGIVAELLVREGQRVQAGQLLARLDATVPSATASVVIDELDQLRARKLRLEAEKGGLNTIPQPAGVLSAQLDRILAAERSLMAARSAARGQRKAQLREQITQATREIDGLEAQVVAQERQGELVEKDLVMYRKLYAQGFAPLTRINELSREAERLTGQRGELVASIARTRTRVSEIQLQILQVDSDALAEVMSELKETEIKLAEFGQQKIAADDQMRRVEIRSPVSGRVHQLAVHTRGGVVGAGETLMLIVPEKDALVVQARIDPQHIDQVQAGRPAHVRFTAFASRTTPELLGSVDNVSADAETDPQTGQQYFLARLNIDRSGLPRNLAGKLVPGMPAEVQIETASRRAIDYALKPLFDQISRAFKED